MQAKAREFVSFFLEPRWKGRLVARSHNLFSLDPDNSNFGSVQLYDSVRQTLEAGARWQRDPKPPATAQLPHASNPDLAGL